jgi:hypothetical protein
VGGAPHDSLAFTPRRTNAGSLTVVYGALAGLASGQREQIDESTLTYAYSATYCDCASAESGDFFAAALTTGDYNADGFDDLAIGAPGDHPHATPTRPHDAYVPQAGLVIVLYGDPSGVFTTARVLHQDTPGVAGMAEAGDQFGAALASGDVNGDGLTDLAVAAPGEDLDGTVDAGAVVALFGTPLGITPDGTQLIKPATPYTAGYFGFGMPH